MWKLLIAEDETTIRRGLKKAITWEKYNIEVIAEADDGEVALELAEKHEPHIMFVDINMPFLNGLELMEKLREAHSDCIFIVITGYDEFSYAQQAIKMKAFDYILKPVKQNELENTISSAVEMLEKNSIGKQRDRQITGNKHVLKERLFINWITGQYESEEVKNQFQLLDIKLNDEIALSVYKIVKDIDVSSAEKDWSDVLLIFSLKNIIKDLLKEYSMFELFKDPSGNVVLLISDIDLETLLLVNREIVSYAERFMGKVILCNESFLRSYEDFPSEYNRLIEELDTDTNLTPIVLLAKSYIDQHYFDHSISLKQVAGFVQVNATYLSKQIKNELGLSFIQYLTNVRINAALKLIKDPYLKVYEIADMVGYSTQHYFCNAFKKVVGTSPSECRSGVRSHE
ncbi:response regulator [Radiobacillus sp. PE A8.2]|uniref:response regulator transcription factor n=1 Tax=Radiobacillus sp. PE A8.2 TaxID=3380349 RepID=UPI00388D882C